MTNIISAGAEAIIKREGNTIIKERVPKSYRHPILDKQIIKKRTKSETKILKKAAEIISVPIPQDQEEDNIIKMPEIKGDKLALTLDTYPEEKQKAIMLQIGESLSKLHNEDIIHGDLTTSNMIFVPSTVDSQQFTGKVFFIDFGLGFLNGKYEDKGVDIHLLKQALEAKHFKNWEVLLAEFEKGYKSINPAEAQKVFDKMKAIEKRGRYKH
ncbi:MAG: KEOPS complex kinase/ATPase Bud32 [Nanoarchaeota archaeon]|jgi:Kae1-associated kinase Bud32|nr:KEOPS complex kinase/ATPase Bud32 [Nanoarchaeota archaeon]